MNKQEITALSDKTICAAGDHLISLAKDIWQHPETGYREERTSALLAAEFEKMGFQVKKGLALTGFRYSFVPSEKNKFRFIKSGLSSLIVFI